MIFKLNFRQPPIDSLSSAIVLILQIHPVSCYRTQYTKKTDIVNLVVINRFQEDNQS